MAQKYYSNVQLMATPSGENDIVNVKYVKDTLSRRVKETVRVVALDDLNADYDSVAQTLTEKVGTALKVDGVSVDVGDRILVAGQLDTTTNGIYVVDTVGTDGTPASASETSSPISGITFSEAGFLAKQSASATLTYDIGTTSWQVGGSTVNLADYGLTADGSEVLAGGETITITYVPAVSGNTSVLKRAKDFDESSDVSPNVIIPVAQGTNGDKLFMLVNDTSVTLDTDNIVFSKYSASDNATEKYVGEFEGNGADTEFPISHGLNTKEIEVTIYDASGNTCYFEYELTSENVITIKSDVVLEAIDGKFKVVVVG